MRKKIKLWLIKWLTKSEKNNSFEDVVNGDLAMMESGFNDTYLFDFKNYASQYSGSSVVIPTSNSAAGAPRVAGGTFFGSMPSSSDEDATNPERSKPQPPTKIKIKPIDALNELETVPTPFSLLNLDDKLYMLKDKEKLIVQKYAKREITALIERLENRKKYMQHKEFFDSFQNTTEEKIADLLKKYDLVMKTSDIFIPEFPDEAIIRMTQYSEKLNLICGKKPIFYVIAEEKDFKKAFEKRDPILLVQSPFGFFYQILGAWDKEMLLLSEL